MIPNSVMIRLGRVIALSIVLMPMARSGRSTTEYQRFGRLV